MRSRLVVLACALAPCAIVPSACGLAGQDAAAETSCAALLDLDGHRYVATGGARRDLPATGRSLIATVPGCADVGGRPGSVPSRVRASEIADVPTTTAVVLDDLVYLREGERLPDVLRPEAPRETRNWEPTPTWAMVPSLRKAP